jgi:acetyl esterase/lipase
MPSADPSMSRRTLITSLAAVVTAACSRAAFLAVNVPAVFGDYTRHTDIAYAPGGDAAHRLDVYVPDKPATGPRPVVVFWYGGRWTFGDKSDYRFVGAALAGLGYVAILPNYRHYPAVKLAGFMADAAEATDWAAAHASDYGADPKELFLMGHSAGAHLAALVALDTRYLLATGKPLPPIAGVIGLSGPYDFLPLTEDDTKDMFGPPEHYPESQPIHFAHPGAPPMLLIHGTADETVWPKNSVNLAAALRGQGDSVTLKLYPGLKHADTVAAMSLPVRGKAPTLADIATFVAAVDRGGSVSPPPSS